MSMAMKRVHLSGESGCGSKNNNCKRIERERERERERKLDGKRIGLVRFGFIEVPMLNNMK